MGAGLATTEDKKRDSTPESSPAATPQWTPSAFAPSGRGAWGDPSNDSSKGGSAAGAPSGMPLFLQPQVQMKCAECAKEAEQPDSPQPPIQKKCAHCEALQAKCPACEAEGLQEKSANGAAADGVANANRPLPHVDRIQASFGRHDVRGARAAVGGDAGKASGGMGALAYTSGNRVAFRSEPDVNLAAHEATHVVQQRNGAKLPGGVGRPGDGYERQADAAARAVERGESAEPILDGGVSSGSGGGSAPAVQHRLEVNAKREFEPPGMPSAVGGGGGSVEGGNAAGAGKTADKTAKPGDNNDKKDKTEEEDKGGKDGSREAPKAAGGSPNGAAPQGAGPGAATPAAPASPDGSGGGAPAPSPAGGAPAAAPAAAAAPAPAPAADPGGAQAPAPVPAPPGGGNAPAGAGCVAACYHGPKDDPPESEQSDEKPADPPPGTAQEQTSDAGEEDLPEPDDCSTQQVQAGAPSAGPSGASATAPAPAQPAGAGGAPAAPATGPGSAPATPAAPKAATGGAAAPAGGEAKVGGSPMDGSIAQGEGQRSAAVASYEASSQALETTAGTTNDLRSGASFAPSDGTADQARQAAAEERANRFFSHAADGLDEAVAFAASSAPDQLGAQAEAAKAQMVASASARKDAISARVQAGRDEVRADAAIAKGEVNQQADSFIGEAQSSAAAAIATLTAAHGAAMGQVDALETATLEQVNAIYANGRPKLEALGDTIGNECTATGEQFAAQYLTFVPCTEKEESFWDGNLSERRATAQAEASRKTAKGYHDRIVDAAKKRAKEVAKDGRKKNRCQVITTAGAVRDKLDPTLQQLTGVIESARDQAIAQTGSARSALLASIDSGLAATLRQLDQQEHEQRQAIDDTCYLQQVLQEQMAHSAAASMQTLVTGAATSLHDTLFEFRRLFESHAAPDPQALHQTLNGVSQKIDAALAQMQSGLDSGMATATGQLANVAAQGLSALASVVSSNDEATAGLTGGFGSQMGEISGQDNFASQRAGFAQLVQQATTGGTGAFQQLAGAMRDGCAKTTEDSQKSLEQAGVALEANLRQQKQGLECQITKEATEAASHEPPAWKKLIAYLLIVLVVLIVIAVTVLTAGAGLGLLAVIALGAVVGAVTAGLITMAQNLLSNQSVTKGLVKAMIVGAITGAAGGAIGMGIGSALGKVAGAIGGKVVAELGATLITAAVMDVGSQFYEGGFSFKHFSLEHLGFSLAVGLVTFGMGKYAESRNLGSLARGALGIGGRAPAGPAPVEPLPAEQAPTEPVPTEPAPTEPAPTEPAPAEPPAGGSKPNEPAPAEPAPAEATPDETTPPPEAAPSEQAPGEPARSEPGEPAAPESKAPEELAPPGEAPVNPEETAVLEKTATKPSEELTPEEVQTEREVASRTKGEPIEEEPFTTKKELPNDHEMKETPEGEEGPCERCSPKCANFDKTGKRISGERPEPEIQKMTDAELEAEIRKNPKAPGDDYADELRYERYARGKAAAKEPAMDFDEWMGSSRGGRPGGPNHQADVAANNGPPNNLTPRAVGDTVPDGVGRVDQEVTIRGTTIKPKPGGRVLVEADEFVWDGKQLSAEARAQVLKMRAAAPNDTIVVTDQHNPNTPPKIYEPGQQPPPADERVSPTARTRKAK